MPNLNEVAESILKELFIHITPLKVEVVMNELCSLEKLIRAEDADECEKKKIPLDDEHDTETRVGISRYNSGCENCKQSILSKGQ